MLKYDISLLALELTAIEFLLRVIKSLQPGAKTCEEMRPVRENTSHQPFDGLLKMLMSVLQSCYLRIHTHSLLHPCKQSIPWLTWKCEAKLRQLKILDSIHPKEENAIIFLLDPGSLFL